MGWSGLGGEPPLSLGVGYSICLGFGAAFSVVTTVLVWLDAKYGDTVVSAEHFNTAGRSVKTGLIAAVVMSSWTWAATLLQSCNVAWQFGVAGPYWYGAGACVQILLFGILSIEIKRKAPNAHTVCEIIRSRWGNTAHKVFLSFCLLTNVLVTSMLLLGGAATISAMTGMNVIVAAFLIPLGIMAYTFADGLAATFLSNYLHTIILHAVLIVFIVAVYLYSGTNVLGCSSEMYERITAICTNGKLGSISEMYERITAINRYSKDECSALGLTACGPLEGNKGGSYLTMFSSGAMMFAVINIIGNFGTVFVDQSYWQAAIAARPSAAVKGYLLGGLCWFAIPFALATSLGLATVALELPITAEQANAGLVPVASAVELLGSGGGVLMLMMVFMAVTSCGSAELIAVSSLLTYDIYVTYIKPTATGEEVLKVSRSCILIFGTCMGALAALLEILGLQLGYLYLLMGILIGSAVFPISSCLLWKDASATGAIAGVFIGQAVAIVAWIATTAATYGEITLETTGQTGPMLAGNLCAILVSAAITIVYGLIYPENYDWVSAQELAMALGEEEEILDAEMEEEMKPENLNKAKKFVYKWGLAFIALMLILWPLLSLPAGAPFPKHYFGLWVWIGIIWGFMSSSIITVLPVYESRDAIMKIIRGVLGIHQDDDLKKPTSTGPLDATQSMENSNEEAKVASSTAIQVS